MDTFTWTTPNATLKEQPRVLSAKFGDGYGQDSPDGLNADLQTWDLVFEDEYAADIVGMRDFLKGKKEIGRAHV